MLCVRCESELLGPRLGCLVHLRCLEERQIQVASVVPCLRHPDGDSGDESERAGSVGERADSFDPALDLAVEALEAVGRA